MFDCCFCFDLFIFFDRHVSTSDELYQPSSEQPHLVNVA